MKRNNKEIVLKVHSVNLKVKSSNYEFIRFVQENYPCFQIFSECSANIEISFSQESGIKARETKNKMERFSKGLHQNSNSIYWENEFGFCCLVTLIKDDLWTIEGFHFDLLNEKKPQEEKFKNFQRSMRWVIHFPLFMMLEQKKKMRLVHASSISKNGRALVFAGLNGVGKSSIGRYIYQNHNYKYNSDNFLLTDGDKIYAFPEKGRLKEDALRKLDIKHYKKNDFVYNKYQNVFHPNEIELEAVASSVFIVSNNHEISCKPLDNSTGNKTLEALHGFLLEFPEYSFYNLLKIHPFWKESKHRLFNDSTKFYKLTFPLNWKFERTYEKILECI